MTHILVADDEDDLRQTLRTLFEGEGYTVSEADDGQQMLGAIRASTTPMVVVLDVLMPIVNGIRVLEAVAADRALVDRRHVYLLLTANNRMLIDAAAGVLAQLGVTTVHKPFDIDALLADVAQAAARLP